jgi:RHS repeat-associated protein
MDRTQWFYDEATGLPVEKRYADGSAVRYTYTPNGKPLRTTQADGSWTEGLYDAGGDFTGSVCSDASLDWSQTLDVDGFVSSVSNEIASTRYDRDETGLVTNEWVSVGPFEHEIVRTYDELGRPASLAIKGTDYLVNYRWSTNGLLEGVDFPGASVHYDYTPDALDAGHSVAVADGATIERTVTRNAQRRGLIDRIENRAGTNALPSFVYAYDLLGRPVTRNDDAFGYNDRSEVVSAQFGTNGVADLYAYDSIGNRVSSRERGVESSYEANELNEYAEIAEGGVGRALAYDRNGNLLTNGVWSYAYDAKDRLTDVWSNGVWVLSNAYDANARRVVKRTQEGTRYFLYDGWNLIQETFVTSIGETNVTHYVWGKDLSGSFQGAGGVGGLLAALRGSEVFIPSYDNNGNIISYSDSEGVSICELRYDAYGVVSSIIGININVSFQFSTKYYDGEIELLYYGFRFYTPIAGRWLNRDPIGESDCLNLCLFVWNNGLFGIDCFGLWKKVQGAAHEWEAEKNDTLWGLASKQEYGGSGKNWICLWPVGETKDHGYPNIIWP